MQLQRSMIRGLALAMLFATLSGCDSGKVSTGEVSEEAKAADAAGQKGMIEFMKTKGASKPTTSPARGAISPH